LKETTKSRCRRISKKSNRQTESTCLDCRQQNFGENSQETGDLS
jgi:hypothetical protein